MEIYTVSFFGHREVERAAEIESKLDQLLHDLITQKQYMVDRSDLVVCCIQHKSGGAYRTMQYAIKQGKQVRNLADCQL